jgi:hypothetical protein
MYLLMGRHRRDTKAWLLGNLLPESALSAMNIVGSEDDEDQEDQARRLVVALCHLAGP